MLASDIIANGEANSPLNTTASVWTWRFLKALAACHNTTGAARESVLGSAWLLVNLKT